MGKQKRIEIKNLFFDDFDGGFKRTLKHVEKNLKVSKKDIAEKVTPKLGELRSLYEDKLSTFYLDHNKFDLNDFLRIHRENQQTIVKENEPTFTAFLIYVNVCVNIYNKAIKAVEGRRVNPTLRITLSLYGLVVRRAMQIADSLIAGFIDAAMIIWRSMYENAVTLLVLALQDSPELSKRFVDHSLRQSRRKISSYIDNHQALGFKSLPKSMHGVVERRKNKLIAKYGKSFLENDYGWAEPLAKGHVTFRTLEDLTQLSRFRSYYILCSEQIHTGFNGLGKYFEGKKLILPRIMRQDVELKSFVDPMQFTVAILHEVNDYIIWHFSSETEQSANILLLKKAFEKLLETFSQSSAESTAESRS